MSALGIDLLTPDELVALNHRIVERLKFLDSMKAHQMMMKFNIGTRVSFETNDGRELGVLTKFNRKTVTVQTDSGRRWNVSPLLISKVTDVEIEKIEIGYTEKPLK